MTTTRG